METERKFIIGSCEEHLEPAIDDYVDEEEAAPDILRIEDYTGDKEKVPNHCAFCEKPIIYVLFKENVACAN